MSAPNTSDRSRRLINPNHWKHLCRCATQNVFNESLYTVLAERRYNYHSRARAGLLCLWCWNIKLLQRNTNFRFLTERAGSCSLLCIHVILYILRLRSTSRHDKMLVLSISSRTWPRAEWLNHTLLARVPFTNLPFKTLRAYIRSNQAHLGICFAAIYSAAGCLILVWVWRRVENPVMPVNLPQLWMDFHFTAYHPLICSGPCTLFTPPNDNVQSSKPNTHQNLFFFFFYKCLFIKCRCLVPFVRVGRYEACKWKLFGIFCSLELGLALVFTL